MITARERLEGLEERQANTRALFNLLRDGAIPAENARVGLEALQLQADLVDLADRLARRMQAR